MAKKARQKISYVLPLANSPGGHRLGVNALAVDQAQSILYSGGRDGSICAWDLNLNLSSASAVDRNGTSDVQDTPADGPSRSSQTTTQFRAQAQAHTHWVNDIVLTQGNTALASASSDLTVRLWRPDANDGQAPQTIGQHADYVKCLATPGTHADFVASGGLDRRIYLWDLNGGGKRLEIEVQDEEHSEKGSVYALSVGRSIMASGGPDSIIRLWDPRSGKRITKFVGHTDNIRDILINETGDTIMTASSDQTVKVWSVTAGRCMHTLTMHNDSVWSLFSDDPQLGIFYSSDRAGLVVKTDVRGTLGEMDDGLSLAVAQENHGVGKVVACGDHIWTATSSSSINRWSNIDTGAEIKLPEAFRHRRASSVVSKSTQALEVKDQPARQIPPNAVLRISNTASYPHAARDPEASTIPSAASGRKGSIVDPEIGVIEPIYNLPEETIEGQHGLVTHKLLNDRRRVLTLDTAGDVLLWDLLQCVPVQSFGKCHLEDVEPDVNTMEAVAPWCSIDTRTGRLAVVLDEYNCFDAEMYADQLQLQERVGFRDDQRINLGRWILRYIFSNLIDQSIKEDEDYRKVMNGNVTHQAVRRRPVPTSIQLPPMPTSHFHDSSGMSVTPRGTGLYATTPNMGIGVATPATALLPGISPNGATPDVATSQTSLISADKTIDYFSTSVPGQPSDAHRGVTTPGESSNAEQPKSPSDADREKNGKESGTVFGKKFRMGIAFGSRKISRSASTAEKPTVVDEKSEGSETSEVLEKEVDDSFFGVIQKIRNEYDKFALENPGQHIESIITPSLPSETPVLKLPPKTTVIIQEETSGGSADLYRGTVATTGDDIRLIERVAPMWLGDLLLQNKVPPKEPVKVSFVLQPWQDELPSIAGADGNARLNANRMLRVKKILAYVAERIEPQPEEPDANAMKAEEYLEMYCYEQQLPIDMTLATLRTHIWKGGADVMLFYRSNGKKEIAPFPKVEEEVLAEEAISTTAETPALPAATT